MTMTAVVPVDPPIADRAELATWTGFTFDVRPVEPSDEPLLADFFAQLTPEDRRFRFLGGLKVGHALLERLTHVDHQGSENFLAFDGQTLIASAMLAADPAMKRAEVAIAIRPEYKHRGIGWTLLAYLARKAEAKGITLIESIECRDNVEAIGVEKDMGFTATACPGDSTLVLLQRKLGGEPGNDLSS